MTIAFDNSSSAFVLNGSSITFSHTVGSGNDRILVVLAGGATIVEGEITGVTYNGVALTNWWDVSAASTYNSSGWYLVNPPSGAHNVVITASESENQLLGVAASFTGVHQSSPVGSSTTDIDFSITPSIDVAASSTDDLVIDGILTDEDDPTPDASQTLREKVTSTRYLALSTEPGINGNVTMSWIKDNGWWAMGGGALKPAAESTLLPNNITQAQVVDSLNLTQANILVINDTDQAQTIESLNLIQANILAINSIDQIQTIDSLSLTQSNIIEIADMIQAQDIGVVNLIQQNVLDVNDLAQGQILERITLDAEIILGIADIVQVQAVDNIDLTQANILEIDELTQTQNIDNVTISIFEGKIIITFNLKKPETVMEIKKPDTSIEIKKPNINLIIE